MKLRSVEEVLKRRLCISCGACVGLGHGASSGVAEDSRSGMWRPRLADRAGKEHDGLEFAICPGKGYPVLALAQEVFGATLRYERDLGCYRSVRAARSRDERFLCKAASGGIMTGVAAYLLDTGRVSGVVATRLRYGPPGPRPEVFIATESEQLIQAQGSKYCPVPLLTILREVEKFRGRVALIGTPCQIASVRLLQKQIPAWKQTIPFCIGNFCGGFRDLRETDTLICRAGLRPAQVREFRYRGGGQPGSMRIVDQQGRQVELAYPGYARRTGYTTHRRCRLCVDATAELADFACGDAWIPSFLASGKAWSLLLTRSAEAEAIANEMVASGRLEVADVTAGMVKESQATNLRSKKERQGARRRLYQLLGQAVPDFDGGYETRVAGLLYELWVLASHLAFYLLERAGLYPFVAKAIRRYK